MPLLVAKEASHAATPGGRHLKLSTKRCEDIAPLSRSIRQGGGLGAVR
jgi:hypothetical protein